MTKRRLSTALTRYVVNPIARPVIRLRLAPGWAVLETIGRKSGLPRRNPVGDGLVGDTFWIVAEHGRRAGYVSNIEANPRVRLFDGGRRRRGTAHALPEHDSLERQRLLARGRPARRLNAALVRLVGTDLLTIRVDLDPE